MTFDLWPWPVKMINGAQNSPYQSYDLSKMINGGLESWFLYYSSRLQIERGQLHSELFGRRHSTLQSHGLFASVSPCLYFSFVNWIFYWINHLFLSLFFIIAGVDTGSRHTVRQTHGHHFRHSPARYRRTGRRFTSLPGGKHPAPETTLEAVNCPGSGEIE